MSAATPIGPGLCASLGFLDSELMMDVRWPETVSAGAGCSIGPVHTTVEGLLDEADELSITMMCGDDGGDAGLWRLWDWLPSGPDGEATVGDPAEDECIEEFGRAVENVREAVRRALLRMALDNDLGYSEVEVEDPPAAGMVFIVYLRRIEE